MAQRCFVLLASVWWSSFHACCLFQFCAQFLGTGAAHGGQVCQGVQDNRPAAVTEGVLLDAVKRFHRIKVWGGGEVHRLAGLVVDGLDVAGYLVEGSGHWSSPCFFTLGGFYHFPGVLYIWF